MRLVNNFFKFLGYLGVYFLAFLQSYLISLICTAVIISVVLSVMSIFTLIPYIVSERYWLVYLVSSVPLAIVFFIIIVFDLIDRQTDYRAKRKLKKSNFKSVL